MLLIETAVQMEQAEQAIQTARVIGVDIETFGHSSMNELGQVRLIQIAAGSDLFVFDLFQTGFPAFLKEVFASDTVCKIFHYGVFDMSHLMHHYHVTFTHTFCTYLAARVLSTGLSVRHALKDLALRYLDIELDKEEQASDWSGVLSPGQLAYAAKDVEVLLPLYEKLTGLLVRTGLSHIARLEFGLQRVAARLRAFGLQLDHDRILAERNRLSDSFPDDLDLASLAETGQKLPAASFQQMLEQYRALVRLTETPLRPELVTDWKDFARFRQKPLYTEAMPWLAGPLFRVRFHNLWLPAVGACAKDYRSREHMDDPGFLRTKEAAMLRALAENDHRAMERYKHHIDIFTASYPGIRKWQREAGETAVGRKAVRIASGRTIHTREFEIHRPDFHRGLLDATISDFIRTVILLVERGPGEFCQYDASTTTCWIRCPDQDHLMQPIDQAAGFVFGRELPPHFYRIEPEPANRPDSNIPFGPSS